MNDVSSSMPSTLADWEALLAPQVRSAQLRLLGEVDISDDERRRLGELIGSRVKGMTKRARVAFLRREHPSSLAAFLVAQGIFGYEAGNFWDNVAERTGVKLDAVERQNWGLAFEKILEELGLPRFTEMEGNRYVSVVLAHGGIPQYSLNDFFDDFLHPAVTRPQYADLPPADLIEELLQRSSADSADKPVKRFLEYGGRVSENFLERCRDMALEYLDEGLVPEASQVGLPLRVVEAYRVWAASQDKLERRLYRSDDLRLRKPDIMLDPWGLGVALKLPSQQIPATLSQSTFDWRVRIGDGEPIAVAVPVQRMGFDLRTAERNFSLERPADRYEVSFVVDNEIRRTWRNDGLSAQKPLMVFDPDSATLLKWVQTLPARRLWLLYPHDYEVSYEGTAQFVDLPECFGEWVNCRAQEWDLKETRQLKLSHAGQLILSLPVRPDEAELSPRLVGGTLVSVLQPTRRTPLYIGKAPVVRIPLVGKHSPEDEIRAWHLTIRSQPASDPERRLTTNLGTLDVLKDSDKTASFVDIPLSLTHLLGQTSYGSFDVRLRGPLGRDADLPVRCWQNVSIRPLESLYVPDPKEGPFQVAVNIETDLGDQVELQGEEGHVENSTMTSDSGKRRHIVWAKPETTLLNLTLARPTKSGVVARVPLQIPIPRLKWCLVDEAASIELPDWAGIPLRQSFDNLQQMRAPSLLVSLPSRAQDQFRLQLKLRDIEGNHLQESSVIVGRAGQYSWRFPLKEFQDTVRNSDAPILRFELVCSGLPDRSEAPILPVLSVTKALTVEDVKLECIEEQGKPCFRLTWYEPRQVLRHRHVRIWPVWQPWQAPIEFQIPDDARGGATFLIHDFDSSAGRFRLQFFIEDPWLPKKLPSRQLPTGQEAVDFALLSPGIRLEQLTERIRNQTEVFADTLERAHIYHDLGDLKSASPDASWCYQHIDDGGIAQALALCGLLVAIEDKQTLRALEIKLFTPHRIEKLLTAQATYEIGRDVFNDYLAHLPRSDILPVDTYRKLLMVEVETIQLAAIRQLIAYEDMAGVEAVLARVKRAQLSDADAVALLAVKGEFAIEALEKQVADEHCVRLLSQLAPQVGERVSIVEIGIWIHTDVGWGRIEQIEDPDTGDPVSRFHFRERLHRLRATLRPGCDAERIEIDLRNEEIRFIQTGKVYTCGNCRSFSARDRELVLNEHCRAAHWNEKEIYAGMGRIVSPEPDQVVDLSEKKLKFAFRAPGNLWI